MGFKITVSVMRSKRLLNNIMHIVHNVMNNMHYIQDKKFALNGVKSMSIRLLDNSLPGRGFGEGACAVSKRIGKQALL